VAFAVVGAALFVLVTGANLATPLYAVYRERFGFSSLVLTLVFATYQLVLCPSLLVFGQLSDRLGRRPVIAGGLGVAMAGLALFALARGTGWLFAARVVQGLAVGTATAAASAALVELAPAAEKARAALVSTLAQAGGAPPGRSSRAC
jgi:MFS family permease